MRRLVTVAATATLDSVAPALAAVSVPGSAAAGSDVAMSASATDRFSAPAFSWSFGDGSTATGSPTSHSYGKAGAYTVAVTSADGAGNAATTTRTLVVTGAATAPVTDTTTPVASAFSMQNRTFRVAAGSTPTIAATRVRRGSAFLVTLSERSTLVFTIDRLIAGRRVGRACRSGRRRGRRCTIVSHSGTVTRTKRGPGAVRIPFTGRIGSRALAPGNYRVSVRAIDGAGNISRARTTTFKVGR